jgi:hypothetical protein
MSRNHRLPAETTIKTSQRYSGIDKQGTRNQEPETRNQKPETSNQYPEKNRVQSPGLNINPQP